MNKFITSQIDSFNGKKYKKSDLLKNDLLITSPMLFKIIIKNNKIFYDKKIVENVFINKKEKVDRKIRIINILQKMLDKYKVKDTILIICFVDGYF